LESYESTSTNIAALPVPREDQRGEVITAKIGQYPTGVGKNEDIDSKGSMSAKMQVHVIQKL
jgi:hypothetical protein